jgi:hypothetical protein
MIEESVLEGQKKKSKLTPSQQSEAISKANNEWFTCTQMIQPILEESREAWQLYLENRPEGSDFESSEEAVGRANIRTSVIAQAIDSVHAQQHLTNFPDQENFFEGKPRNEMAKTNRKICEAYMAQEMRKLNFLIKVFQDRKNLLLDGTSVVATPFKRVTKMKAVYTWPKFFGVELPFGKPKKTYKETVVSEGTDFQPLRLEDWRVNPTIDDWKESPFLYKYYAEVEALQDIKAYQNTKDLTSYQMANDQSEFLKLQKLQFNGVESLSNLAVGVGPQDGLSDTCALVMERWGDFFIDGKKYENHLMVWANESVLLYFGENPYDHGEKPFELSPYNPIPNSPYGKGCVKDAIPEAHALDSLNNKVLDILANCADPWATYLDSDAVLEAYMDGQDVVLSPGKMIPVKSHDSIKERSFVLPNLTWIGDWAKTIREDIRESTGGVPYATGGMTQGQDERTLGEVQILANGTSTRFMSVVGFYELTKLLGYAGKFFENARQFASEPVYVSDFDQVITPETLKLMEMDFEVTGSRSVMEQSKNQQARMNWMQNILPPMIANGYATTNGSVLEVDVAELAKDAAIDAKLQNADDRLKVVSKAQEISQQADNPIAAEQASQQLMGGGNGPQNLPQNGPGPQTPPVAAA